MAVYYTHAPRCGSAPNRPTPARSHGNHEFPQKNAQPLSKEELSLPVALTPSSTPRLTYKIIVRSVF